MKRDDESSLLRGYVRRERATMSRRWYIGACEKEQAGDRQGVDSGRG